MFLKVPGWHHGPPPDLGEPSAEGRGRDATRVLAVPLEAVSVHVVWVGGPAPGPLAGGHHGCSTSMSPLRVDCLLLRPLSHSQTLTALCSPSPRPAWTALLFSAFTGKVETRGRGHRPGQASRQPRPSRYSGVPRPRKQRAGCVFHSPGRRVPDSFVFLRSRCSYTT